MNAASPMPNRDDGFTLVEVLASLLVIGIGLFGMGVMQMTSLRNNQSSYFRSQVTQYGFDMMDRMRANPAGVLAGTYDDPAGAITNDPGYTPEFDCLTLFCEPNSMAIWDLSEWGKTLVSGIPGAKGIVCADSNDATQDDGTYDDPGCSGPGGIPNPVYAIKIWWDDNHVGDTSQYQRFVMVFQP